MPDFRAKAPELAHRAPEAQRGRIACDWPRRSAEPDAEGRVVHPLWKSTGAIELTVKSTDLSVSWTAIVRFDHLVRLDATQPQATPTAIPIAIPIGMLSSTVAPRTAPRPTPDPIPKAITKNGTGCGEIEAGLGRRLSCFSFSGREESQIRNRDNDRDDQDGQHELDHAFAGFLFCVVHCGSKQTDSQKVPVGVSHGPTRKLSCRRHLEEPSDPTTRFLRGTDSERTRTAVFVPPASRGRCRSRIFGASAAGKTLGVGSSGPTRRYTETLLFRASNHSGVIPIVRSSGGWVYRNFNTDLNGGLEQMADPNPEGNECCRSKTKTVSAGRRWP